MYNSCLSWKWTYRIYQGGTGRDLVDTFFIAAEFFINPIAAVNVSFHFPAISISVGLDWT